MALSKSDEKLVRSLKLRKNRNSEKLFVAEGEKLIQDLLQSEMNCKRLFFTSVSKKRWSFGLEISEKEMKELSHLSSPSPALAVFEIPASKSLMTLNEPCFFAAHELQDPGNMGTIIRTLDWFGPIPLVLLSGSVDPYNPKTVQASMGSIARLPIYFATDEEFKGFLVKKNYRLLAAHMHGIPFKQVDKGEKFCIVIGNEGRGLEQFNLIPDALISIPPSVNSQAESLNASIAAAILAYECAPFISK